MKQPKLLSKDTSNAKLAKTHDKFGRDWETLILYLAPAQVASIVSLCPASTPECRAGCLYYAGRAAMFKNVNEARMRKTRFFVESRDVFISQLHKELTNALRRATKAGKKLAVRLNGTSDVDWSHTVTTFPDIQFYDYTKLPTRAVKFALGQLPHNYNITFSRSETNSIVAKRVLAAGGNVAVVYDERLKFETIAAELKGVNLINGDLHDARFLDDKNAIILLKAKGKARKTASDGGFVLTLEGLKQLAGKSETVYSVAV